jgi:predicted transposase YdaD
LGNDYDKILKENIAGLLLPLTEKYLGIKIKDSQELKDKLQTTIEKEPDFIRIVRTDTDEEFILHLEFQTRDEEGMVYRMQEYYGLLRRKHGLPVKQFVIYLGRKTSRMKTQLPPGEVFTGFALKSLKDYSYESLLDSQVPEEIILAVLADFRKHNPAEVLKRILERLKEVGEEEITLRKYVRQLSILVRLRNLTRETHKQVQDMGLLYDITKDYLYQEGLVKGVEEGVAKGREEEKKKNIAKMLLKQKSSVEEIADFFEVTVAYVEAVARELKK